MRFEIRTIREAKNLECFLKNISTDSIVRFHQINMAYKVITKVLVARIRPVLNDLIGPFQGIFIPEGTPWIMPS